MSTKAKSIYYATMIELRGKYPQEYERILCGLVASCDQKRKNLRGRALVRLKQKHLNEYRGMLEAKLPEPRRNLSFVKPFLAPRKEMDPFDAVILFERGMTVPEMARYDNCTQSAALRALLPQLLRRRPLPCVSQLADELRVRRDKLEQVLGELELAAA